MWQRIQDAMKILFFGRTGLETRLRALEVELASLLEKLNMWSARQAKRDARQLAKNLDEQLELSSGPAAGDKKSDLRRRVFELSRSGKAGPFPMPAFNPNQLETPYESSDSDGELGETRADGRKTG